jgi:CheY-like chemotaxis protein
MTAPLRALLVEDSLADAALVQRTLRQVDPDLVLRRVRDESELRAALAGASWDIVLSDFVLPAFSGLEALAVVREGDADLPFILLSGVIGAEAALAAMRAGASDFLSKQDLARLPAIVEREVDRAVAGRDLEAAHTERLVNAHHCLEAFVASCAGVREDDELAVRAVRCVSRILGSESACCLVGEGGSSLIATSAGTGAVWRTDSPPASDDGLLGAAISAEEVITCDEGCDLVQPPGNEMIRAASACAAPLMGRGGCVGGIVAWSAAPGRLAGDGIALLRLSGTVVAVTVQGVRLARQASPRAGIQRSG